MSLFQHRARLALVALSIPLFVDSSTAAEPDPCLAPPPLGYTVITGTAADDQIIGTSGNDYILGLAGDDVLKGGNGDDILCGDVGDDGVNGVGGNDSVSGGPGNDLVVGAGGNDKLWGGLGKDGVYGGPGIDTIEAGSGGVDDGSYDYLAGGADADPTPTMGTGDEYFAGMQGNTACPTGFSRRIGAFGAWRDTAPRLGVVGCKTIRGPVTQINESNDNDGDLHMKVRDNSTGKVWVVELMPRDFDPFPNLAVGNDVEMSGLHVTDDGHDGHDEIHPVFKIHQINANVTTWSGPMYAGSPEKMRPGNPVSCAGCPAPESYRFCWTQDGDPCTPWANAYPPAGDGEIFRLPMIEATRSIGYDIETYQ